MKRRSISTSFLVECTILRVLALIDAMTDGYPEWEADEVARRRARRRMKRIREDEAFDDHMTGPTWRNVGGIYEDDT